MAEKCFNCGNMTLDDKGVFNEGDDLPWNGVADEKMHWWLCSNCGASKGVPEP